MKHIDACIDFVNKLDDQGVFERKDYEKLISLISVLYDNISAKNLQIKKLKKLVRQNE